MKVKVGDKIYDGEIEPVMVIFAKEELVIIKNMDPDSNTYASFPDDFGDQDKMYDWMGVHLN